MDYHYHARTTIHQRKELAMAVLERRLSLKEAAASFRLSRQSAAKWVRRFRDEGEAGLRDLSCRPRCSPRQIPADLIARVEAQRRRRWTGMRIARELGLSPATVSRVLRRLKLSRIRDLEPRPPLVRYEHPAPGDMVHFDIKRLVRIQRPSATAATASRASAPSSSTSLSTITPDLLLPPCIPTRRKNHRHTSWPPQPHGSKASASTPPAYSQTTDHAYVGRHFQNACHALGLKHRKTRPYTPRTNGKAGTLHPNRAQRMGLRPDLSKLRAKNRRTAILHPPIQLAQTSRQSQPTTTHLQSRTRGQQSLDPPQVRCLDSFLTLLQRIFHGREYLDFWKVCFVARSVAREQCKTLNCRVCSDIEIG